MEINGVEEEMLLLEKEKMRKLIYLIIVSSVLTGCAQKSEKVERIIENGVEVIISHS